MSNVQHSSSTDDWGTPDYLVEKARKVLMGIDLDPASSKKHNDTRVRAPLFWTAEDDSLSFDWSDRLSEPVTVLLNPPSKGKAPGNKSWAGLYWSKLMQLRRDEMLLDAVYFGFSLEQLAISQKYDYNCMCEFPFCVPANRTKFVAPEEDKHSPTHSNIFVYVPGIWNNSKSFAEVFGDLGCIINEKIWS